MNEVQQWDICRDCLNPLEVALRNLANRWNRPFVEIEATNDDCGKCSAEPAGRQQEPPQAFNLWCLYQEYDVQRSVEWLNVNVSCEYGDRLQQRLWGLHDQLSKLEFRCCQILNGDNGTNCTVSIRFAVQRIIARHEILLRELFPMHEERPDVSEMPDDMRTVEVEIVEAYSEIGRELFQVCKWLECVTLAVETRRGETKVPESCGKVRDDSQPTDSDGKSRGGRKPISDREKLNLLDQYESGLSDGRWNSQEEFAERIKVSRQKVSRLLIGARALRPEAWPRPENIPKTTQE